MHNQTSVMLRVGLLLLALLWGAGLASAQSGSFRSNPRRAKATMTDAGGRKHVRPAGRISEAQRKAAARNRSAGSLRWKHAHAKNPRVAR